MKFSKCLAYEKSGEEKRKEGRRAVRNFAFYTCPNLESCKLVLDMSQTESLEPDL